MGPCLLCLSFADTTFPSRCTLGWPRDPPAPSGKLPLRWFLASLFSFFLFWPFRVRYVCGFSFRLTSRAWLWRPLLPSARLPLQPDLQLFAYRCTVITRCHAQGSTFCSFVGRVVCKLFAKWNLSDIAPLLHRDAILISVLLSFIVHLGKHFVRHCSLLSGLDLGILLKIPLSRLGLGKFSKAIDLIVFPECPKVKFGGFSSG